MEVCVKQGEIVNKHLKVEMNVGDVLCYGLDEKLVSYFAQNSPPLVSFPQFSPLMKFHYLGL